MIKLIKNNLNGYFSWDKYIKFSHHDHKFGTNKFEYFCQMPIVGVFVVFLMYVLIFLIGYGIIRPIQFIMEYKHEKQKKSNS